MQHCVDLVYTATPHNGALHFAVETHAAFLSKGEGVVILHSFRGSFSAALVERRGQEHE